MRMIYLYTSINWYRLSLFRSLSGYADVHVYILNNPSVGYQGIAYSPDYEGINITFLKEEESGFAALCRILDQEDFDAIVVPSMNSAFYLRLTTKLARYYSGKGKAVLYFWEYWPMESRHASVYKKLKQVIRHIYTRRNIRYIDRFLVPGIYTYAFYKKMGVPSFKLVRCHNASEVSEEGMDPKRIRQQYGIGEEDKIVLYFGRIEEYKGIYELIRVFRRLDNREWHLLICGPGGDQIRKETDGDERIHIAGSVSPQDRCSYYAAANVFVLPNTNKGKAEPWGLTVNEAMAFGVPVLATEATGSAVDLIFNGVNGYIMNSDRLEEELSFYLNRILTDPSLEKELGKNGKDMIGDYTFDHMARAFVSAAEQTLLPGVKP